jgi:hypothetical protein
VTSDRETSPHGEVVATALDLALVGIAAIPLLGAPAAGVVQAARNLRQRRVAEYREQLVNSLSARVADLEATVAGLVADERKADLLVRGAELASNSDGAETVRLIGRIVADGLLPDANSEHLTRASLLLDLASQLHPDHIAVLTEFAGLNLQPVQVDASTSFIQHGFGLDDLRRRLPSVTPIIGPLVARLESLGLVNQQPQRVPSIPVPGNQPVPVWEPTQFGRDLIAFLQE